MKYYDIHISDDPSYSVFIAIPKKEARVLTNQGIANRAVEANLIGSCDLRHVDNVTEISEDEFNRATKETSDVIYINGIKCMATPPHEPYDKELSGE